jgi:hypothetical protein
VGEELVGLLQLAHVGGTALSTALQGLTLLPRSPHMAKASSTNIPISPPLLSPRVLLILVNYHYYLLLLALFHRIRAQRHIPPFVFSPLDPFFLSFLTHISLNGTLRDVCVRPESFPLFQPLDFLSDYV